MNKGIQTLTKLAKLEEEIILNSKQIAQESKKLSEFNKAKEEIQKQIESVTKQINEAKNTTIKQDIHIKELNSKLERIATNSKIASTDKAIKALNIEEEVTHESIAFANSEIERQNEIISSCEKQLEELNAKLDEETQAIKQTQDEVDSKVEQLQKECQTKEKEKEKLTSSLDENVASIYLKIKKWAKESAVVPIRDGACYGCYLKVSDNFHALAKTSNEILTCPNCSRIVYIDNQNNDGDNSKSESA